MEKEYEFEIPYENKELQFLNVPKPIFLKQEYEVTDYSMDIIKNKYPMYQNNKDYKLVETCRHRRQMSLPGAYLKNQKGIDIVADIMTSDIFKDIYEGQEEDYKLFLRIYHTVGNILPVCEGINTRWGRNSGWGKGNKWGNISYAGEPDCCWLKMKELKDHIEKIKCDDGKITYDNEDILDIIKIIEDKIDKNCYLGRGIPNKGCLKYWAYNDLRGMTWKEFVEQNYLQDFVIEKDPFSPICLKLIQDGRLVPGVINELNRMIVKRGYRIWNMGKDILDDSKADEIIKEIKYKIPMH